ncbi:MAG: type II toxin-antitoxin system VapC family toxin [Pseudomonadota bacterium]
MIAVDASALVAIATKEEGDEALLGALMAGDAVIGTPALHETFMVLLSRKSDAADARAFLSWVDGMPNVRVSAFDQVHLGWSRIAIEKFGKGGGSGAKLNILDCMAYASARVADAPLLFTGGDFRKTDIQIHPVSRAD